MFDDFYGLTGKPFQLTPDPAFYFRSASHRKALSCLGYGLAQGDGFIVITGEVGSGKSTLVAHLAGAIDRQRLTLGQIVTSKLGEAEIVHLVAQSLGLDIGDHDKAGAFGAIEGFLHGEARAGRRCLLIVDESQNLSVEALEELRTLSDCRHGNHPLLQTLLLGQPEFRAMLQGHEALEDLRQRVIAAHHLQPMERAEIEPYLAHRLERVGWTGNPQFDQRVLAEIHQASGGIPRRINQIASRLLLLGAVEQRTRIDAVMLKAVLDEMAAERAFPAIGAGARSAPRPQHEPVAPAKGEPRIDQAMFDSFLAERDAQISELQQAVVELANQQGSVGFERPDIEALVARMTRLEARVSEQERSIRRTLTMLIEWIEGETEQTRVA